MDRIRQLLCQPDTVLFVGSGISLWSGLPGWSALIEELALFVERAGGDSRLIRSEASRGEYLQAASYGFDNLTKPQIGEFIRLACRYGKARPHEIHKAILSLGPTCFITSNYDNLIEESIRIWKPAEFFRPPVTNRNLTALGEIVHASSVNFIFKPHGDASDSDSIVLTREQYRELLPGGERHAALESLKLLLASRPIIYLGFGLRDPDFVYIRDLLANTYKGGARDHYAIMADVTEPEISWWRRNYGVHLHSYKTTTTSAGNRDHSSLLSLLNDLSRPAAPAVTPDSIAIGSSSALSTLLLSLARHAARLTRHQQIIPELPIRVTEDKRSFPRGTSFSLRRRDFNYRPVKQFLIGGPHQAILIGLPGAGKSYAISRAAAQMGETLHRMCLEETPLESEIIVPVLIDMKMYRGNLQNLIEESLPTGVLRELIDRKWKIRLFVDSFNEMPREHAETKTYEADFSRTFRDIAPSVVIASRTTDGLSNFGFCTYQLDEIDNDYVIAELNRRSVSITGRFKREVLRILQKPFYFQLYVKKEVTLSENPHPREIFDAIFNSLRKAFHARFTSTIDLLGLLQNTAYNSIEQGNEAWTLEYLLQLIRNESIRLRENIEASDVANWLVSQEVLIPYSGTRIAFFHQSVTEFLAATELARQFTINMRSLSAKLAFTRWDQALYLTLSILPAEPSNLFLDEIIRSDLVLALHASKYLEFDRDQVTRRLLDRILTIIDADFDLMHQIAFALEHSLPVSSSHADQLRKLIGAGGTIGGAAAKRIVDIFGSEIKPEIIDSIYANRNDYNYCVNGAAPALAPHIGVEDLLSVQAIVDRAANEVSANSPDEACHGLTSGVAALLKKIEIANVANIFLPPANTPISAARARVLCSYLDRHHSTAALQLAAELLIRGVDKASTAIYFILNFRGEAQIDTSAIDERHVHRLILLILNNDASGWGQRALACVCQARLDLQEIVKTEAEGATGLPRVALIMASGSKSRFDAYWQEMSRIQHSDSNVQSNRDWSLLEEMEVDWTGHEELLVGLIRRCDIEIVSRASRQD